MQLFVRNISKTKDDITFENFSEYIVDESGSNSAFLDFLKVKIYSIIK